MTTEQLALDCEPDWNDDAWDDDLAGPVWPDLRGQGLTALQLHTMTDVQLAGRYL